MSLLWLFLSFPSEGGCWERRAGLCPSSLEHPPWKPPACRGAGVGGRCSEAWTRWHLSGALVLVTSSPCIGALTHSSKVQVEGERRAGCGGAWGASLSWLHPGKEVSGSLALQGRTQRGAPYQLAGVCQGCVTRNTPWKGLAGLRVLVESRGCLLAKSNTQEHKPSTGPFSDRGHLACVETAVTAGRCRHTAFGHPCPGRSPREVQGCQLCTLVGTL